ncbi:uncharacterized protein DC041_0001474, partial [Schistosoma bovis]
DKYDCWIALLISFVKWYEIIISLPVATVFASLAILWGEELHGLERKWRILLLTTCCIFAGIAFILFILGVISGNNVLQGSAWIFWCCATLIVSSA